MILVRGCTVLTVAGLVAAAAGITVPAGAATAAPVVSSVSPSRGSETGGNNVEIYGTGFRKVTGVTFGGVAAVILHEIHRPSTELAVYAPAHDPGTVDVRVTTAVGTSAVSTADQYTYVANPTVTSVSPTSSDVRGHPLITVTGTNFTNVTHVTFGESLERADEGRHVQVLSPTELQFAAPGHYPGTYDVYVWTKDGKSLPTPADQFTFGHDAPASPWTVQTPPLPAGAAPNTFTELDGLDCADATDCAAWGQTYSSTQGYRFAFATSTNGSWSATTTPVPSDAKSQSPIDRINGIGCGAPGQCAVVGQYTVAHEPNRAGLLETESDGTWHAARAVPPAAQPSDATVTLLDVACTSDAMCFAVGDSDREPIVETFTDSTRQATLVPLPTGATGIGHLYSIACPAPGACVAVGLYRDKDGRPGYLAETLANGTWTASVLPMPADAATKQLSSLHAQDVACASAGSCVAVGQYRDSSRHGGVGFLDDLDQGTWTTTQAMAPAGTSAKPPRITFAGVSCNSDTCVAVGGWHWGNIGLSLLETRSGGTWSAARPTTPKQNRPETHFDSTAAVACGAQCIAVGIFHRPFLPTLPLVDTLSEGSWSGTELQAGADDGSFYELKLRGAWCGSDGGCVAVGTGMIETLPAT